MQTILGDSIDLVRDGVKFEKPQRWADLGCGNGEFTLALAELLAPGSEIFAIDKSAQSLPPFHSDVKIHFLKLDFVKDPFPVGDFDGILMANTLNNVENQSTFILSLFPPKLIFVEFERSMPSPWAPFPLPSAKLASMLLSLGYDPQIISAIPSRVGDQMYSLAAKNSKLFL